MPTLDVRALPQQGFFRAGRFWPNTVVTVEVDDDTAARLEAEPKLSVRRVVTVQTKQVLPTPVTPVTVEVVVTGGQGGAGTGAPTGGGATVTTLPEDFPGRDLLVAAGYGTVEAVAASTDDELVALKGIGKGTVAKIREALTPKES
jgi:hypothetical protein